LAVDRSEHDEAIAFPAADEQSDVSRTAGGEIFHNPKIFTAVL